MKKSKILMPLTGIAAVGAFAPVIAMSACHKQSNFIADSKCGLVIDANLETMTNKLGTESLATVGQSGGTAKLYVSLAQPLAAQHTIKASVHGNGSASKDGTPFVVTAKEIADVGIEAGEDFGYITLDDDHDWIQTNSLRIAELVKEHKTESFSFVVTYEELDKDSKSVNKQDVTYTLVAAPELHDLVALTTTTLVGAVDKTVTSPVTLGGWALAANAGVKITLGFKDKTPLVLYTDPTKPEAETTNTLTMDGSQTYDITKGSTNIAFTGKLKTGLTASTSATFKEAVGSKVESVVTFHAEDGYYTQNDWEVQVEIDTAAGIEVTAGA